MLDKLKWQCWHCGACCKLDVLPSKIKAAAEKAGLKEKANGYCNNYDNEKSRCSIYDDRPSICRNPKWVPGFIKTAACIYLDNKINNQM